MRVYQALVLFLFAIGTSAATAQVTAPPTAGSPRVLEAAPLAGAWTGHWTPAGDRRPQPVELIVAPGDASDRIVGQFTFLSGAQSWTARRIGLVVDGALRFELLGGGTIVLGAEQEGELSGTFEAPSGRLPATQGSIRLRRAR